MILPGDTVSVERVSHPCAEDLLGNVYVVERVGAICFFSCPKCGQRSVAKDVAVLTGRDPSGIPLSWLRKFDVSVADVSYRTSAEVV